MAIARSALTSGNSATNGTSFSSASVTPTADNLILLTVYSEAVVENDGGVPSSVSGNGLTWVKIAEATSDNWGAASLWRAMGSSPSTGAVSLTFTNTQNGALWQLSEFSGIDTGGTNGSAAVVQNATTAGGTGASFLVTLAAFSSANNATFGAFGSYIDSTNAMTHTPGSGFTELYDDEHNPESWKNALTTLWRTGNDTTVDATLSQASDNYGGIAIEIAEAAAGTEVTATTDALILTENAATVNAETSVTATVDTLTLTEFAASVSLGVVISATTDALALTEFAATIKADNSIAVGLDALTLTELVAVVNAETSITATLAALTLTEFAATITATAGGATNVLATTDALILTELAAGINAETNVNAGVDSLIVTTYASTITVINNIAVGVDALTLTEYAASITSNINIAASLAALTLTEYSANISVDVGPTIDGLSTDVISTDYGEGRYYDVGNGTYYKL